MKLKTEDGTDRGEAPLQASSSPGPLPIEPAAADGAAPGKENAVHTVPGGLSADALRTWDLRAADVGGRSDPFVTASMFDMKGPFFPPHPHAGFSVATYILPESPIGFWNQDTLGNRNHIAPGSIHLTVAGRGMQHEETPERRGRHARGFQIWIDHAAADREVEPSGQHLAAPDVPRVAFPGGEARILIGGVEGRHSPLRTPTPVRILDLIFDEEGALALDRSDDEQGFVWVRDGGLALPSGRGAGPGRARSPFCLSAIK